MTNLKLGRLPKVGMTRITFAIPEPLKEELYAAEHSRLYEPVDAATLIPHMLEAFLRSDHGWRGRKAAVSARSTTGPKAAKAGAEHQSGLQTDQ